MGGSKLTLNEIGVVVCLSCMDLDPESETLVARIASDEFKQAIEGLKEKGVLKFEMKDGVLNMQVDLDAARNET